MTNSNAMINYAIIGGLCIGAPLLYYGLSIFVFTGDKSIDELSPVEKRQLGVNGYSEVRTSSAIQAGGAKLRRKTKRHRHYKTQSVRNKK